MQPSPFCDGRELMNLRCRVILSLGIIIAASLPVRAAEPYLEFVEGLRQHSYHDYALIYLDKLEKRADVPAEVKEVIPFEKAITLLAAAHRLTSPEAQTSQLDQARAYLEQFLKSSPGHAMAGRANTELANVIVGRGKVDVLKSKSPGNAAQKAELQKKARAHFAEARQVFQAAHDRYKEAFDKFGSGFINPNEKVKYEARETAYRNYIQAQLNLAVMTYEEAQTYDKGSPENKKILTEASKAFDAIHGRYRQQIAGLYARMWEGKCFEEQDDITKALGFYNELLGHGEGKSGPALKRLQDRVLHFRLVCLNREQRKDYQVVIDEAQKWLKENRNQVSTPWGLGIQWELVRALEMLGKKEETPEPERNRLFQQALTSARAINRFPGEYKDGSTAIIQRLLVGLDREPGDPKDFATALGTARNLTSEIAKLNKLLQDATGPEREKLIGDLQPVLKETARILNIGLSVTTPKDDAKEVNLARYYLAYVYYSMRDGAVDRSYDAAVLAEYVARKSVVTFPDAALEAAYLAQAAYIQAYHHPPQDKRAADLKKAADFKRIIAACNFITDNWPTSDKAHDSRMELGRVYSEIGQPAEAAKYFLQIPETASQYLVAQLAAGNAFWVAYLTESIRPEDERKPKEELDGLLKRSTEILRDGLVKFEAQLPGEIAQVDQTKLDRLTRAKLNYSQILNASGDYKGALSLLTEGRLPIVAAVAAPEGDEAKRPPAGYIASRQFAGAVYQVVLRTYVGLQNLDKARETMRELEKIVGTGGGGASLTQIYLDLGKELQKEVERLQAARDPRLAEVLKSFETFLEDMSNRKEGQDYNSLTWVAETYRALGEGLQQGDASKAEGYFGKSFAALQFLLDEDARKPGFIPAGAALGVKLKAVKSKRLQKDFEEAHKRLLAILDEKSKALDVQEEAAQLFQDWAARGELEKWDIAIEGGSANKKNKSDKKVWGWFGLAEKLKSSLLSRPNPEYERQYLDASYHVADCWFKYASAQSTNAAQKKLLIEAYKAVRRPAALVPNLGGGETWARFNALYRKIQDEMLSLGMEQMRGKEVADFEKRNLTKEERAEVEAKLKQARDAEIAAVDGEAPAGKKPKAKGNRKNKGKDKAKAAAETNWAPIVVVIVLILIAASGGAYFFLAGRKKKKRRRAVVADDADIDFGEPRPPTVRTKV